MVIVEAKTGFKVSSSARKDISSEADIPAVLASWDKQMMLNKERAVEGQGNQNEANQFAYEEYLQRVQREEEARKKEERKAAADNQ